jgi:type II secretory pathway pseudopilin PulG
MVHYSTIVGLAIVLIIIAIALFVLYSYGIKQQFEKKERENCFLNASKICMECQLPPSLKGLKECENKLSSKCKELLDEKSFFISDCSKYLGK